MSHRHDLHDFGFGACFVEGGDQIAILFDVELVIVLVNAEEREHVLIFDTDHSLVKDGYPTSYIASAYESIATG